MVDVDFDAPVALPAPDSIAVQQDAGAICIGRVHAVIAKL